MSMLMANKQKNERGFASFIIALTLVIVINLITVGFAQLARREQQNALNKQLAVQAYYAAESGIDDTVADIKAGKITTSNVGAADSCTPQLQAGQTARTKSLDSHLDVSYSCVSVDLSPTKLAYTNVADGSFRSVTFASATSPVASLTVSWSSSPNPKAATSPAVPVSGSLKQATAAGWGTAPALMEVSLTPIDTTNFNHKALADADFTVYGYPVTGSGSPVDYTTSIDTSASSREGTIVPAQCDATTLQCSLTITGPNLASIPAGATFLLHLTDHYDTSNISVSGLDTGGQAIKFTGAQAVVDATGRVRNVLKRIQVHVPLNSNVLPNYAIEAANVCKRIQTYPGSDTFADTSPPSSGACTLN
jgi:Tfp pilus assembly protein PilX